MLEFPGGWDGFYTLQQGDTAFSFPPLHPDRTLNGRGEGKGTLIDPGYPFTIDILVIYYNHSAGIFAR
jgi:hypothetical protein